MVLILLDVPLAGEMLLPPRPLFTGRPRGASLTHYGQGSWESARPVSVLKEIVAGSPAVAKKFNQAEKSQNLIWTSAEALLGIIGLVM